MTDAIRGASPTADGAAGAAGATDAAGATARLMSGELWAQFCDLLKAAGDDVLRPGVTDPLDVAEGYRMLTRLLRGALEGRLEWGLSSHPALICTCHETIKIVAENPDNLYLGCGVNPRYRYRVWGTRGEARWLSFNTFNAGGFAGGGRGTGTTLHEHQLAVAPDGTFEVIVGLDPPSGAERGPHTSWLALEDDSTSLAIRQTFLRKGVDQPADLHIERIDADPGPPPPLDAAHLERALFESAHYVRAITNIGASWAERNAEHPNVFWDAQEDDTRKFKDPQIGWHMAYVDLAPDEALVVDFTPPECDYWMICLHNHWMETLDYRYHQITLNNATAAVHDDGSVRCVVAHADPGVANWLDLAGHRRGVLGVRWVGRDVAPVIPATSVVPLASFASVR